LTATGIKIAIEPKMKMKHFLVFLLLACSPIFSTAANTANPEEEKLVIQKGMASFYGIRFHNRKTASGEVYNFRELTAAHKHLPFGTLIKVTNLKNNKVVVVKVNDRLPQSSKRVIDVSKAAAIEMDMVRDGVAQVQLEVLKEVDVLALIEHFQDQKPEDLRLRYYEKPIEISRPEMGYPDLRINPEVKYITDLFRETELSELTDLVF
jgi:rare lipoprotein A